MVEAVEALLKFARTEVEKVGLPYGVTNLFPEAGPEMKTLSERTSYIRGVLGAHSCYAHILKIIPEHDSSKSGAFKQFERRYLHPIQQGAKRLREQNKQKRLFKQQATRVIPKHRVKSCTFEEALECVKKLEQFVKKTTQTDDRALILFCLCSIGKDLIFSDSTCACRALHDSQVSGRTSAPIPFVDETECCFKSEST
mmetsp:Transcript_19041/g.40536  ORF Transcript_19041/g.40536 Transcript_19041/m.40536 type:complete len:198 (-) Transcript_19041:500-1093(-)